MIDTLYRYLLMSWYSKSLKYFKNSFRSRTFIDRWSSPGNLISLQYDKKICFNFLPITFSFVENYSAFKSMAFFVRSALFPFSIAAFISGNSMISLISLTDYASSFMINFLFSLSHTINAFNSDTISLCSV